MMKSRIVIVGLAAAMLLLGVALSLTVFRGEDSVDNALKPAAKAGGDFVLQSADGPVALSDYRGKIVVLYFGYAACPDVCPTSLGLLSLALRELSTAELDQVQPLFISVDPERDTVDSLKTYARAFHDRIIGITGTPKQIEEIARRYGVLYMKVELPDSALGYAIDHSSMYYVIGRDGEMRSLIRHGTDPEEIVITLREALAAPTQ
ncbi:MAG: SCO family protein [Granulosicoccaceae bacterium]|jgi:protein SCO1/2